MSVYSGVLNAEAKFAVSINVFLRYRFTNYVNLLYNTLKSRWVQLKTITQCTCRRVDDVILRQCLDMITFCKGYLYLYIMWVFVCGGYIRYIEHFILITQFRRLINQTILNTYRCISLLFEWNTLYSSFRLCVLWTMCRFFVGWVFVFMRRNTFG